MKIAIIGAGNVGQALATALANKKHNIYIGSRDTTDPDLQKFSKTIHAQLISLQDAAAIAEVVILSVPWPAIEGLSKELPMQGKVVIDCTNPLKPDLSGLMIGTDTSAGEVVQEKVPNAKVIKAFNTVGFNIMQNPVLEGRKVVMPYCGNDEAAKNMALQIITDVGFEPMDVGPIQSARLLEPFALLWIHSAMKFGMGRDFAFSLLKKDL